MTTAAPKKQVSKQAKRRAIIKRDKGICCLCGLPVDLEAKEFLPASPTLDHILARSKGGTNKFSNLQLAHRWCNLMKGHGDHDYSQSDYREAFLEIMCGTSPKEWRIRQFVKNYLTKHGDIMRTKKTSALTPRAGRVIVKAETPPEKTRGGLYLPESKEEKPSLGKIVAVGKDVELAEGQTVLFDKYSGTDVEFDGDRLIVLKDEHVLAVVGEGE